ncbi:hypothetical protein Hypma_014407 [Hypsizygus marmoreus]|uniref:Uncharacterized protein n=1 Tax=Hypsizygus marmoreus TaxID=39966 RepID=A0A369JJM2_HYPMA|nr:hypothetical protein Hypma_014407 [Hypsizygus marmoreus]
MIFNTPSSMLTHHLAIDLLGWGRTGGHIEVSPSAPTSPSMCTDAQVVNHPEILLAIHSCFLPSLLHSMIYATNIVFYEQTACPRDYFHLSTVPSDRPRSLIIEVLSTDNTTSSAVRSTRFAFCSHAPLPLHPGCTLSASFPQDGDIYFASTLSFPMRTQTPLTWLR